MAPRLKAVTILIIAQIVVLIAALVFLMIRFPITIFFGLLLNLGVVLWILRKDKPPAYKLTWVVVVLSLPMIGGAVYLVFGDKRPTKKIAAYMYEHAIISTFLDTDENVPDISPSECGRMSSLFNYIRRASSYHAYQNTATKYYELGEHMFVDMLAELSTAKKFIFLEYFIISKSGMWDEILEILLEKVKEGVDVRLIVDDLGSMMLFTGEYAAKIRAQGIKLIRFNPMRPFLQLFMNNRDHRKIMVIDGHTAFSGGANIADEYINRKQRFGVWKDTGLRLKGEAVWSYTLMFIEMWDTFCKRPDRITGYDSYRCPPSQSAETDGYVLPFGDTPLDREQLGEAIYIDMLNQAERYVYIFTPYLIISEYLVYALQTAAKRGIDVRIVTPGIPDKKIINRLTRAYYRYLLKAGVRIYEYTPGFMHAKSFVSDDKIAVVGTINLDYRSLYLHFECGTLLYNSSAVKEIMADAEKTIAESREVQAHESRVVIFREFGDAILHLFSPLL